MRARSVRVRLLVGADRELRDVAVQRALGEIEADVAAAGATFLAAISGRLTASGTKLVSSSKPFFRPWWRNSPARR